jgi:uroporphyrinogen III methyltransferase / synthase
MRACDRVLENYFERVGPFPVGVVSIVGTGPGDGGLITVKGAVRIRQADVVVHSGRLDGAWRALVGAGTELIVVGPTGGGGPVPASEIVAVLKRQVALGRRVVRVKSGDPFVFNRTEQECVGLRAAGIAFEIVAGVTSGLAGAVCAGIGITEADSADAVTLVIGHDDPEGAGSRVDYGRLVSGGTVVVYFGERHLGAICRCLLSSGVDGGMPVAVVTDATFASQRVEVGTVAGFVGRAEVPFPSVLVIGWTVSSRSELGWFERRSLFGQRVVVTRPVGQSASLSGALSALGAEVLEAPTVSVSPVVDDATLDEALRHLGRYDWVVLTSGNGVDAMSARMRALGLDARSLGDVEIAAIGTVTARRLEGLFLRADLVPAEFTGRALGAAMVSRGVENTRCLLLRSSLAGSELPEILRRGGASCDDLAVYRSAIGSALSPKVRDRLVRGEVDWVTFTSSSTFTGFVASLGSDAEAVLGRVKIASIGPITSEAIRVAGYAPTVEAAVHTGDGVVTAIAEFGRF